MGKLSEFNEAFSRMSEEDQRRWRENEIRLASPQDPLKNRIVSGVNAVIEKDKLAHQLEHDFYKRTDAFRDQVKLEALTKAAEKYPEPFNPDSWSSEQLARHAMAENYDQSNYINGLYEKLQKTKQELDKILYALDTEDTTDSHVVNAIQKMLIKVYDRL